MTAAYFPSNAQVSPGDNGKSGLETAFDLPSLPQGNERTEHAVSEHNKATRERWLSVAAHLQQAKDQAHLLEMATGLLQQTLGVERVVVVWFQDQVQGKVVAESMARGWTPALGESLPATMFGLDRAEDYNRSTVIALEKVQEADLTPYQQQLLERFQVKSLLVVPLSLGDRTWGLLSIQRCQDPQPWDEAGLSLAYQVATELTLRLQQQVYGEIAQTTVAREQQLSSLLLTITQQIQQATELDQVLSSALPSLRQILGVDRTAIYRFNPDWTGSFVAESVVGQWPRLVGEDVDDTYFAETQGSKYRQGGYLVVNDLSQSEHTPCHRDLLERFQTKAYVVVPLLVGEQLWGLLGVYHNGGSHEWQESEVESIRQVAAQVSFGIQLLTSLQDARQQTQRERTLTKIVDTIRQSLDPNPIFRSTTQEVRQLLNCDRVALYQFNPDWSGEFVAESVVPGWVPLLGSQVKDTYFERNSGGRYVKGEFQVIDDVSLSGFDPCHLELLEQFQAKAYVIVPVLQGDKLWGLLAAYQNGTPRHWEESEVNLLFQIGSQFGLALQQAEYLNQLKDQSEQIQKSAERERGISLVIDKMRQTLDLDTVFTTTTREVRALLRADRVGVYRFNADWSGEFVAESVASGWIAVVQEQKQDPRLLENSTAFERCTVKDLAQRDSFSEDTYLQSTQGGGYARGDRFKKINNIYEANFTPCYLELLERYQAKAYLIVPIVKKGQLWGLFAAYQNAAPREWQDSDINLMQQIGTQLGIVLDQAEYLSQLQTQSQELAAAAERERKAKEQLQSRAIDLLRAVRPVFSGDLTVRAPITEDEVGTIADAYNNTIQSLRRLVTQVQEASLQVAQTITSNGQAVNGLSTQAEKQVQALTAAVEQMQAAVQSTQAVGHNAQAVEVAVQQANQILQSGDRAMNRTVDGIQAIRETVAETSKKIKRLSESSQKISKVVSLIGNFATQTNLLALNAAIEATRAGEYGRGFAVVADEVRSLARQSAAATADIEKLVQAIQAETSEVAAAMDTGIQQVVEGTALVNETRDSLNAIVVATAQISDLVGQIAQATGHQNAQSAGVTQTMTEVSTIATATSQDCQTIADSFQDLLALAQTLQTSVGQFKVS